MNFLIFIFIGCLVLGILGSTLLHSQKLISPAIGSQAPDFSLEDENSTLHTLSTMRGSRVALYFYPKDQTPSCTTQACSIRDNLAALREKNIIVWGISYDSPKKHAAFKEKYHLTFPLLSDSNKRIAALYGVRGIFFAQRITFLIDEQGYVVGKIDHVDVKHHAQQIINGFGKSAKHC